MVGRCCGVDVVDRWLTELDRFCEQIGPRGSVVPSRGRGPRDICAGWLPGWTVATAGRLQSRPGEVSPDGMQRLLRRAQFDVDGVRDDVRDLVVARLGDRPALRSRRAHGREIGAIARIPGNNPLSRHRWRLPNPAIRKSFEGIHRCASMARLDVLFGPTAGPGADADL
jgi:hypothetical protein